MTQIAFADNNKILLNTLLDETMFSKTHFTRFMNDTGFIVSKDSEENFSIIERWAFSGTMSINEKVYFYGEGFSGTPVAFVEDENLKNRCLFGICQAIDCAINKNIELSCNSIYGIFISDDESKLLFLPEKAFDKSAMHLPKSEYNEIQSCWLNQTLSGQKALLFLQATIAYFALTGTLPYPADNESQSINIYDKNFLPIRFKVNGISNELYFIDEILGFSGKKNPKYIKTGKLFSKQKNIFSNSNKYNPIKKTDDKAKKIPLEILREEIFHPENRKIIDSNEIFLKKAERFRKKQNAKILSGRFLRRNKLIAITATAIAIAVCLIYLGIANENSQKRTLKGLDSTRTTLAFYKGLHKMDTDLMELAASNCSDAQIYIQNIPLIWSTHMIASSFNLQAGIAKPVEWLFLEPMSTKAYSKVLHGLTNFTIDEKPSLLNEPIPTVSDKPSIQKSENGQILKNGSSTEHQVHYYFVHSREGLIRVENTTSNIILHFDGEKWQISSIQEKADIQDISPIELSKDLKAAIENFQGNIPNAVDSLREKYSWLPSRQDVLNQEIIVSMQ